MDFIDIVTIFIPWFIIDFEFEDISDDCTDIFTQNDIKHILSKKTNEMQVYSLFWLLTVKGENYQNKFIRILEKDYKWLANLIHNELSKISDTTVHYLDVIKAFNLFSHSQSQKHEFLKYNVHRCNEYMEIKNALLQLKRNEYVMLYGSFGKGKKWLAYDVLRDFSVMSAMNFKIYCVDVGECTDRYHIYDKLKDLRNLIKCEYHVTNDNNCNSRMIQTESICNSSNHTSSFDIQKLIKEIKNELKALFHTTKYKDALLVLLNVDKYTWKEFHSDCKTFLITRSTQLRNTLSNRLCKFIDLTQNVTLNETYEIFNKYLNIDIDHSLQQSIINFYEVYKGNLHYLSLIASNIAATGDLKSSLNSKTVTKIQKKFDNLMKLNDENKNLYDKLAIFPESVQISIKLLSHLWERSEDETVNMLQNFLNSSLIRKHKNNQFYELPFECYWYLEIKRETKLDDYKIVFKDALNYYGIDHEIDENNSKYDHTFYQSIGLFLKKSERLDLFPKLFFNFTFLEKQIRCITLQNTIGYLNQYQYEIECKDGNKDNYFKRLISFLSISDHKLNYTNDVTLLQCALLLNNNAIQKKAIEQVKKYPNNVWFTDMGNFHYHYQIYNLLSEPERILYIDKDIAIITLKDNSIILTDIMLDFYKKPILIANGGSTISTKSPGLRKIIDIRIFNEYYIIVLNDFGELNIWAFKEEYLLILKRRTNYSNEPLTNDDDLKCIQSIHRNLFTKKFTKIRCFDINDTQLYVTLNNGDIMLYTWDPKLLLFKKDFLSLRTNRSDITRIKMINMKLLFTITDSDEKIFWCLRDSSEHKVQIDFKTDKLITYDVITKDQTSYIYFICADRIIRTCIKLTKSSEFESVCTQVIYKLNDTFNVIRCGQILQNSPYAIIGTEYGLIVINTETNKTILLGEMNANISCIDVTPLGSKNLHYMVLYAIDGKHSIFINNLIRNDENNLIWDRYGIKAIDDNFKYLPDLNSNVQLCGGNKFDLTYNAVDGPVMFVADTDHNVHKIYLSRNRKPTLVDFKTNNNTNTTIVQVTNISVYDDRLIIGFKNGKLYDSNIDSYIDTEWISTTPVKYTKLVSKDILLVVWSGNKEYQPKTYLFLLNNRPIHFQLQWMYCFPLYTSYLLMINEFNLVRIININTIETVDEIDISGSQIADSDLKNNILYVVTNDFLLHIYKFSNDLNCSEIQKKLNKCCGEKNCNITCIRASDNGKLIAIASTCGCINLYQFIDFNEIEEIYRMKSHKSKVNDLKFSPCNLTLVSTGDSICYWNISYMINNCSKRFQKGRQSSRFNSHSSITNEDDASIETCVKLLNVNAVKNVAFDKEIEIVEKSKDNWDYKYGLSHKPELFACIVPNGNNIEKIHTNPEFSQFLTIDNKGGFFNLHLFDNFQQINTLSGDGNGNELDSEVFYDSNQVNNPKL